MTNPGETISIGEKIGYAVGDTASNLYFQTFLLFIPIFYTDVVGLPADNVLHEVTLEGEDGSFVLAHNPLASRAALAVRAHGINPSR